MKDKNCKILAMVMAVMLMPVVLQAKPLKTAMDEAAEYFVKRAVRIEANQELHILEIVNFSSGEHDTEGKRIETELYFALERQMPDFRLFLGPGEEKDDKIVLRGTYEPKGKTTVVKVRILKEDEVVAQYETQYDTKARRRTLVAVLDIEARALTPSQRKGYSDMFRTYLGKLSDFEMASSADIDKMNPDQIQAATGCTRDSCATIIGEQLGVDRVVSSSLLKMGENNYVLSSKIMDIKDGSILVTETVEHKGSTDELKGSIEKLARKLTGNQEKLETYEDRKDSNFVWHVTATSIVVAGVLLSNSQAQEYNDLANKNEDLKAQYAQASSDDQKQSYLAEYEDNQNKMSGIKQNIMMYDTITALAVGWEIYLLFFTSDDEEELSSRNSHWVPDVRFAGNGLQGSPRMQFQWKW